MQPKKSRPKAGFSQDVLNDVSIYPALFDDSKFDVWHQGRIIVDEADIRQAMRSAHHLKFALLVNRKPILGEVC